MGKPSSRSWWRKASGLIGRLVGLRGAEADQPRRRRIVIALTIAALVLAAAGWLGDRYTAHGFTVDWYVGHHNRRVWVTRTTELRTTFPNNRRPLARYLADWDYDRFGVPEQLPRIDAELHARLTVPEGPARRLRVVSPNHVELSIERRAPDRPLPPGVYGIHIHWQQISKEKASLHLSWQTAKGAAQAVPTTALRPEEERWLTTRLLFWLIFSLCASALLLLVYWASSGDGARRAARLAVLATVLVVGLGAGLRVYDYDVMPSFQDNGDWLAATWNGWSLLAEGKARGWSLWSDRYGDRVEKTGHVHFGQPYTVISPYFDHPPLLHLLAGAAAYLGGARDWRHVKLEHARIAPLLLSVVALVLIVFVGRRVFAEGPAPWLGALLYAVLPFIVLQSRVVKEEALLVVLSLGSLLCFLRWRDDGGRLRELIVASVLAGLCVWAKATGVVYVAVLFVLVASEGSWRSAFLSLAISAGVSAGLLLYAAAIDWGLFWFVSSNQAQRPMHWNVFAKYFDSAAIDLQFVGRSWVMFLWLATAAAVWRVGPRRSAPLTVPLIGYLGGISMGAGSWFMGWYATPLYPFLCICAGKFLADLWKEPDLFSGALFIVLLVMYTLNFTAEPGWFLDAAHWPTVRRAVMLSTGIAIAPFVLVQMRRDSRIARWLARGCMIAGLLVVTVMGGKFVVQYDSYADTHRNFDFNGHFR